MTDRCVTHATFSLERTYDRPVAEVFAAWAEPSAKARWFSVPGAEHQLEFRVGGREVVRSPREGRAALTFDSRYQEIVPGQRIVYSSALSDGDTVATVSITTVEFTAEGSRTRLRLTESGAFLDGLELPTWREQGTSSWLDALGAELQRPPAP